MTKIITTIGPVSLNKTTLDFFKNHSVQIARMNLSHNTPEWHYESAVMARESGLELLFDCPGPKIRLGNVDEVVEVKIGQTIKLESQQPNTKYPYKNQDDLLVFPYEFPVHEFVEIGHTILVDDGKQNWEITAVNSDHVICQVNAGGLVKSRKSMNMPQSSLEVSFLGDRDKLFINELMPKLRPEYAAASFVKTKADLDEFKGFIKDVLEDNGVNDYYPKICAKLEMREAVSDEHLASIVAEADLIMIARGDLALETAPAHVMVPMYQDKIIAECKRQGVPVVVATQMLESMMDCPVPTRAEVSDMYRAITSKADFVMCSGETAVGNYAHNCVELMDQMINMYGSDNYNKDNVNIAVKANQEVANN
jgi:pyruvate kinase